MPVKMYWSLRSTCLLWYILVPMVGTVLPFYQRENVWQQYRPSSDNLFSLSSGNVWQDQPSWDQPRPFVSGGALQQWSSLDSPSPDQPRYSSQLMFSAPFGNERYRGTNRCHPFLSAFGNEWICFYCKTVVRKTNLPEYCCHIHCPSRF
ncbi:uncharacterized protein [Magallana gigas]|uniref:uncharacterized protein n=1 Tax=Magallana gigas TaxID=29159 RepID=UPI00333E1F12